MSRRRVTVDRVRVTRVGFWYILFTLIIGLAAANSGNNALYLVEAMLLALLVVSGVTSRRNLARLEVEVDAPREIYARQTFTLRLRIASRDRWLSKRLLVLSVDGAAAPRLIPHLAARSTATVELTMRCERRGLRRLEAVRVASVFPIGLIYKSKSHRVDRELLVLPEIRRLEPGRVRVPAGSGDGQSSSPGRGHELLTLREFRSGDDPRAIHWKQSARTGKLVFMEREAERGGRVTILFDNAVGVPATPEAERRFERRVSDAASAADRYFERGDEVRLVTRDLEVPFGRGRAHRLRVLEALALVEARREAPAPLRVPDEGTVSGPAGRRAAR